VAVNLATNGFNEKIKAEMHRLGGDSTLPDTTAAAV
jgi:hypothetical protein